MPLTGPSFGLRFVTVEDGVMWGSEEEAVDVMRMGMVRAVVS